MGFLFLNCALRGVTLHAPAPGQSPVGNLGTTETRRASLARRRSPLTVALPPSWHADMMKASAGSRLAARSKNRPRQRDSRGVAPLSLSLSLFLFPSITALALPPLSLSPL